MSHLFFGLEISFDLVCTQMHSRVNKKQMQTRSYPVEFPTYDRSIVSVTLSGFLTYDTHCQCHGVPHIREVIAALPQKNSPCPLLAHNFVTSGPPWCPWTVDTVSLDTKFYSTWPPKDPPQSGRKGRDQVIEGRGGWCPFHCLCQIHSPVKRMSSDDTDKNPHTCSENVGRIGERRYLTWLK